MSAAREEREGVAAMRVRYYHVRLADQEGRLSDVMTIRADEMAHGPDGYRLEIGDTVVGQITANVAIWWFTEKAQEK